MVGTLLSTSFDAGVDTSVIALWLGHQSAVTTHIYLHADMTIKERALARVPAPNNNARPLPARRRPHRLPRTTMTTEPSTAGYAARATPAKHAEQHEHRHRDDDLGITGTSA